MLTDTKLRALKAPASGRVEYQDDNVPGLRVRVSSKGTRTFILRKRQGAKVHNVTLGTFSQRFGLADARRKARSLLNDLEVGKAPITRKRVTNDAQTFRALLPIYLQSKEHLRSHGEVKRILEKNVLPEFGDRLADTITRGEVTKLTDDTAVAAPTMARAVHAQLSSFFTWAMPRLERLHANPCRDAGRPSKPKPRERVLTDAELALIWKAADALPSAFEAFYKLLIVTGQRRDEVAGMTWSELDRGAAEWVLPTQRTKNSVANVVALSVPTISLLDQLAGEAEWPTTGPVLTSNGEAQISGYSKAKRSLDAAMAKILQKDLPKETPADQLPEVNGWRVHDIRRTVATGLQRLGVRFEVTEAVLNHVSGARGGIAGVYQRHDWKAEKRDALEAWGQHVQRVIGMLISASAGTCLKPNPLPAQGVVT